MGRKKYSSEFKQKVVLHYLNSGDGAKKTARLFGVDHGAVRRWTEHWKVNGVDGFTIPTRAYSAEFKESEVKDVDDNVIKKYESNQLTTEERIFSDGAYYKYERTPEKTEIYELDKYDNESKSKETVKAFD